MLPPYIVKTTLLGRNTLGMTLFPFILINKEYYDKNLSINPERYKQLINHEKIHIRQQVECLILPFFLLYGIMYLINMFRYTRAYEAYRNIPFEKEAFDNDKDLAYLQKRKWYAWV